MSLKLYMNLTFNPILLSTAVQYNSAAVQLKLLDDDVVAAADDHDDNDDDDDDIDPEVPDQQALSTEIAL
jgi:hypothetical protein